MTENHQQLVAERVRRLFESFPDAVAVLNDGVEHTWGEIAGIADGIQRILADARIAPDEGVAVVLRSTPFCFGAVVALLAAGRGTLVVTPIQSDSSLAAEIRSLRPAVLIAEADDWQRSGIAAAAAEVGLAGVQLGGDGTALVKTAAGLDVLTGTDHVRTPPDMAISVLTSGTTGPAKRYPLTWAAAIGAHPSRTRDPGVALGVTINALPLVSIGGVATIVSTIFRGRPLALMDRFDVWKWAALIRDHQPRVAGAPPAVLQMVLDAQIPVAWFASVQSFVTASAPLAVATAQAFEARYRVPIMQSYGATEFLGAVTGWTGDLHARFGKHKLGSVGRALPGVSLRVVDTETFAELGPNDVGRLEVRSPRQITEAADGGWVRTTDLARIDVDGFVWIVGRADDVIIRGGFKIDPHEVEATLREHPHVHDACVVPLPDKRLGSVPVAAVVAADGAERELEGELIEWVRGRLAPYKAPTQVMLVDAIPLNSMMKTHRTAVVRAFEQHATPMSGQDLPASGSMTAAATSTPALEGLGL